MSRWQGSAPSNIAMIKYMGKKGTAADPNQPLNPSISWTIDYLRTFVEIELRSDLQEDKWEPHPQVTEFPIKPGPQTKFMNHFSRLKKLFEIDQQFFVVRSGNNFPADCGIASSASSFAALTRCAFATFQDIRKDQGRAPLENMDNLAMAQWSRQGSGSSCRSLFKGWVEWDGNKIQPVNSSLKGLIHAVLVVSEKAKSVTSSEAHQRVATSLLMEGREKRATTRFNEFKSEIQKEKPSWSKLHSVVRAEMWDMHALFETSEPSFGYMSPHSTKILNRLRDQWEKNGDGPIITMDAGPNIHLMWREDQLEEARQFKTKYAGDYLFINDERLDSV